MSGDGRGEGRRRTSATEALVALAVLVLGGAYLLARGSEDRVRGPQGSGSPASGPSERVDGGSGLWDAGPGWLEIPAPGTSFPVVQPAGGTTPAGDPTPAGRADSSSLADFRGLVVVLNFWATWCPPCEKEIPELVRLQNALEDRPATVVGVAVASGDSARIMEFARDHGMEYPLWRTDSRTAASEFEAFGLPVTLLVDGEGVIRRRYLGPQRYETLRNDVGRLLRDGR